MCTGVGEGSVSEELWRPVSEGRSSPSGLLYDESVINFSIFSDICSDAPLPFHDNDSGIYNSDIQQEELSEFSNDHEFREHDEVSLPEYDVGIDKSPFGESGSGGCIASQVSDRFVIDHSIWYSLCTGPCNRELQGCRVQLNSCSFYRELFLSGEVDPDASFLYHGVGHGFDIVDPGCPAAYHCTNYDSINSKEFKSQMDVIVSQELIDDKVTMVVSPPTCIHSLGGIKKGDGKLRPIIDCRRPLHRSINNYMESTFIPFHYVTLDDVCNNLEGSEFLSVVDIKAAYRSINISAAHRTFQGFRWEHEGQVEYFTDNCLSFGLRCAPTIFTRFTQFIVRCMARKGFKRIYAKSMIFWWWDPL